MTERALAEMMTADLSCYEHAGGSVVTVRLSAPPGSGRTIAAGSAISSAILLVRRPR
jgi:hypothetical protein